jgi:hypothetical protein
MIALLDWVALAADPVLDLQGQISTSLEVGVTGLTLLALLHVVGLQGLKDLLGW